MITNIRLSNFRAFQSGVNIRIRPITILIGKNSAGKSSLIKFLLMLRQTLESKSDQFFVTDGRDLKLGSWIDLRHTNTRNQKQLDSYMRYRIDIRTQELPSPEVQAMWQAVSRSQFVSTEGEKIRVSVEFEKQSLRKESSPARFGIDGRVHYGKEFKYGTHEVIGWWDNDRKNFRQRAENLQRTGFLRFAERTDSISKLVQGVVAEQFLEPLRQEFLKPKFLSPIREESERVVQTGSPPPRDVGLKGEFAIPHLAEILKTPEKREHAEFIRKFAFSVTGIQRLDTRKRFAKMLTEITAQNPNTLAASSLADFGFGVSQCLPIFIQGALMHPGELLVVEQPEAQLHPTAQLELGSFFADLWTNKGVPSLIETHSPNILLRLRKLISQGKLSPDHVSVAYFSIGKGSRPRMEEIFASLGDFAGGEKQGLFPTVVVKNLNIDQDGSLEKGLPMEFFGADVLEALEMGLGK